MKSPNIEIQSDSVESLVRLIEISGKYLQDAGNMLCRLLTADPDVIAKVRERAPSIPVGFLANLVRVGEKTLHPNLLLNNCPAYQKIRLLPYSAQSRALSSDHIDLVTDPESGNVLRVAIAEMSPQQASQVFTRDGIRSRDDQRAWLKLKQLAKPSIAPAEPPAWMIKKDRLVIGRACEMSRAQLISCLAEMA